MGIHYVFLTNNFKLTVKTLADIYKARWQVDLLIAFPKFQSALTKNAAAIENTAA